MYIGDPASCREASARGITSVQVRAALSARDDAVRAVAARAAPIDQLRFPADAHDDDIEQLEPAWCGGDEAGAE